MTRVAITDDHPVARRGLAAILAEAAEIEVVSSFASPAEFDTRARPDVLLLDLYHGEQPCLEDIARLKDVVKVLVVSASGRPADVLGAIRAGAAGYLTKLADPALLVAAVLTVAGGGFALSPQLADILQAEMTRPVTPAGAGVGTGPDPGAETGSAADPASVTAVTAAAATAATEPNGPGGLSPREEQTLDLIAQGFTHAQAARRMGVSKATVDTYVERIRAKLQVGNKAELARAAFERRSGR